MCPEDSLFEMFKSEMTKKLNVIAPVIPKIMADKDISDCTRILSQDALQTYITDKYANLNLDKIESDVSNIKVRDSLYNKIKNKFDNVLYKMMTVRFFETRRKGNSGLEETWINLEKTIFESVIEALYDSGFKLLDQKGVVIENLSENISIKSIFNHISSIYSNEDKEVNTSKLHINPEAKSFQRANMYDSQETQDGAKKVMKGRVIEMMKNPEFSNELEQIEVNDQKAIDEALAILKGKL
jgi:hypothetical protein